MKHHAEVPGKARPDMQQRRDGRKDGAREPVQPESTWFVSSGFLMPNERPRDKTAPALPQSASTLPQKKALHHTTPFRLSRLAAAHLSHALSLGALLAQPGHLTPNLSSSPQTQPAFCS